MRSYLIPLCDMMTVHQEPVLRGLINVNHAPRPVLASLPGVDEQEVERIIAARARSSEEAIERLQSSVWLLLEGIVDLPTMKSLLPLTTTGGDVVSGQVIGMYDDQSTWSRREFVIDGTSRPARVVYCRSLQNLGEPLLRRSYFPVVWIKVADRSAIQRSDLTVVSDNEGVEC